MKTLCLLFAAMAFSCSILAQTITNYQFAASSGTFTPLPGGTTMPLSGGNVNDGWFNGIPTGFTFYYMGVAYTTVSASTNGWMAFGQNITGSFPGNSLTWSGNRPLIAPLWDDLDLQAGTNFSYQTSGTNPNRIFTAEWMNVKWGNTATSAGISFQVKLYEASGKIEFVYRQETGSVESGSASIGITSSGSGNGNYLSLNGTGTNPIAYPSGEFQNLNQKPANGQVYAFIPPASPAPPINMTFTSVTQTGMTINWIDNSITENWFVASISQDGVNYSQIGSAITSTTTSGIGTTYSVIKTALLPGVTYYYRVTANNVGNSSAPLSSSQPTTAPGNFVSGTSGNWSNPATWSTTSVPTSLDNVTISDGHTVIIDAAANCNALTVGQGTSGILRYGTTATSLTIIQGVTVSPNGIFDAGVVAGANLNHTLNVGGTTATDLGTGSLAVNGNFDMYIGTSNGKCTLTFFGIADASVSGFGTIDFNTVTLNKGTTTATVTVTPPVLEILSNFTVQGTTGTAFLATHTAGTLKLSGSYAKTNPVYTSANYSIPATGGLWVNNPNFTVTGISGNPTNNGLLRLSSGTCNIGSATGNAMSAGTEAVFNIEGGTMNISGRLNTSSAIYWIQSDGVVNITTIGNSTSNVPGFGLTNTSSVFTMSGGTLCQVLANTGTTRVDYYNNAATNNITGGTLQLGNSNSGGIKTFYIRGTAPNVVLTNTSANHNCTLAGDLTVKGDLTLNGTGAFSNANSYSLTMAGMNATYPGNFTLNTGSNLTIYLAPAASLSFTGSFGNQALINYGTITAGTLAGLTVNNTTAGTGTVTIPGGLTLCGNASLNLTNGTLDAGTGLTLGTAGATGFTYVQGNGTFTGTVTKNFGSGTVNYTYNGTSPQTTGIELPGTINGTLTINNSNGVSLNTPVNTGKLVLTSGTLTTTSTNIPTVTGTAVGDVSSPGGQVSGPLQRTLPANRTTGTTYLFPLRKSIYRPLELVNPITNAGGTVVIKAEVFDADCGGTPGSNMASLNTDRYWTAEVTSGSGNFTSTTIRLTETGLTNNHGIARSLTKTGSYDLVSSAAYSGSTLVTDVMTSLSLPYYVIGQKSMQYVSSTTTQYNTNIIRQASTDNQIIGIQVVTTGNLNPASVTSFTLNTNGTTNAGDIVAAKLYYTGFSSTFAATGLFGTAFVSPSGAFTIDGSQALVEGTNYFWLAYDINPNAGNNNLIDGECNSITYNGAAKTPAIQAPAGSRTIKAALTGTFTVGTSGTYPTLTGTGGLFDAINIVGLRGNVTAQIISNTTETGLVALSRFYEVGGTNFTLTIQPDAAVERVISGSCTNGLIRLTGADRVTFDGNFTGTGKYLNFINTKTSGPVAAIQLVSSGVGLGATNVTIKNCRISAGHNLLDSYGISAGSATPGSGGQDNDSLTIQNCNITRAYCGIFVGATADGINNSLIITGDSIGSSISGNYVGRFGIYVSYTSGITISGNTIFNIMNPTYSSRGIYFWAGCVNATISKNLIAGIKYTGVTTNAYGSAGIDISTGFPASNLTLSNNLIYDISGAGNPYFPDAIVGIRIHSGTGGVSLYYNSVNLSGTTNHSTMSPDNSAAIYIAGTGDITMKNNIFRNSIENTAAVWSKAYAIYSDMYSSGFTLIDYNNYFAGGSQGRLGYIYPATATTIEEWRTRTSQDDHSIGDDPFFKSNTDLHLDFTAPALHGGNPVPGILTDFENVARNDPAPAMGALETGVDCRGPVISFTPLGMTASLLDRTLPATLTDYTGVPVTGAGLPVLYWNINHGSWGSATGVCLGASEYQFTFGAGVSPFDSVFYYIAAQDTWATPNVSVNPGAGASGSTINPPAFTVPPSYPEAYKIAIGLNGTITVGSGGMYPTLTGSGGLFQTLNENLLTGNVEATIISDLTEPGTYRLYSWTEAGAGNYSVTISPDGTTERLITGSPSQGLITLDGPSRVTINGSYGDTTSRYLRFRNTNTSNPVIHFLNGATGNVIRNCYLESSATGGIVSFGTSTEAIGNSNNFILYNIIRDRTDSPSAYSYGVYSIGTDANPNKQNTISGNEILNFGSGNTNFAYSGIYIHYNGNGGGWIITGNSLYNNKTTPPAVDQRGIYFAAGQYSSDNRISGNFIGGQAPQCGGNAWVNNATGFFYGIYLDAFTSNYIENNTIQNINQSNSSSDGFTGIYLYEGYASIAGNTIGHDDTSKTIRSATYNEAVGISAKASYSTATISKNTIANLLVTTSFSMPVVIGIYMYSANIRQNRIFGIGTCTSPDMYPKIYGIWNDGLNGMSNEISNNSIALSGSGCTEPQIYGYYEYSYPGCSYQFFNNSISISGPATSYSPTYAFYSSSSPAYEIKDNVLVNLRQTGGGGFHYAIYVEYPGSIISDYNDLYSATGIMAYYNSFYMADLAGWQAETLLDTNSIGADPFFMNQATDLHPDFDSPLLMAGIPLPDVTVDIVDTSRSLVSPSIGAYEITTAIIKTWNGTISATWSDADNWTPAGIPVATDNLSIPSGTLFNCTLNATGLFCKSLIIRYGATAIVSSGADIIINGNLTLENGGTLTNEGFINLKANLMNRNQVK